MYVVFVFGLTIMCLLACHSLLQAFVGRSFALLRPFGLIIYIVQVSAAATERARRRAAQAQYRGFGPILPNHTITLLLSLVFCIVNPLILVAAIANFCTAAVVERYGWIYAYRRWYESGGRLWRQVGEAMYSVKPVRLAALLVVAAAGHMLLCRPPVEG